MNGLDKDFKLIVTATYMAEPMKDAFCFWQKKLGVDLKVEFSPLNSVFNQLMDPSSDVRNNRFCNAMVIRFDDWYRVEDGFEIEEESAMVDRVRRNFDELVSNLINVAENGTGTYMVFVSPAIKADLAYDPQALEKELMEKLAGVPNVYVYSSTEVESLYDVEDYYDAYTDAIGHIPYKQNYFEVFATLILRKVLAFYRKPYKVVALDCDNTLWKGVIGEDGIENIKVDESRAYLQRYMKSLKDKGMLLCLCSKNNEAEVWEAFEKLDGMVLTADDIVAGKINWNRKSENLKELAGELNLGLDSIVFIDDSMAECMEVRMSAPEVLTLTLPQEEEEIKDFVRSIWALDVAAVTEADKTRTEKYKENAKRNEYAKTTSYEEFIDGLALNVDIAAVTESDYDRAYQMMLRINQFNFTAQKYSNSEFADIVKDESSIVSSVKAKDRFGDYGMIGLIIMKKSEGVLKVCNLMLSCRALCKGIEYQMLAYVGNMAKELGCADVEICFAQSGRNSIAEQFVTRILGACEERNVAKAEFLAELDYRNYMENGLNTYQEDEEDDKYGADEIDSDFYDVVAEIASELNTTEKIHKAIVEHRSCNMGERAEYAAPTNEIEEKIVAIWEEILEVERIGINDSLFSLGGESIKAIQILSRVRAEFDADISLAVLFEGELTVARLAEATQDSILSSFDEDLLASELEAIENMSEEELAALLLCEV